MPVMFYTGNPRSGKSYMAVHDLLLTGVQDAYFIMHNIEGLDHERFKNPNMVRRWPELIGDDCKDEEEFFTFAYQESLYQRIKETYDRPILWVFDEASRFFDRAEPERSRWVSYHGHWGQQIWMITQDKESQIHRKYAAQEEFETRAKNGGLLSLPFIFLYEKRSRGKGYGIACRRKRKDIYSAYKSFECAPGQKHRSMIFPFLLAVIAFSGCWYWYRATHIMDGYKADKGQNGVAEAAVMPDGVSPKKGRVVERIAPANSLNEYRFSGLIGDRVMVQRVNGGGCLYLQDVLPKAQVVGCTSAGCRIFDNESGSRMYLSRRGVRLTVDDGGRDGQPEAAPAKK